MNRPKFCMGEVVDAEYGPTFFKGLEVVGMRFVNEGDELSGNDVSAVNMWGYFLSPDPVPGDPDPWAENLLRKRNDDNWKNIEEIWNPLKVTT